MPIVRRVQNDPWHRKYYDVAWDQSSLLRLAKEPETLAQPPNTLVLLARNLRLLGAAPAAVEVLRDVHRRYPADLWVNLELSVAVGDRGSYAFSLQDSRRYREEGLGYLRAAVAANPQSPALRQTLAFYLLENLTLYHTRVPHQLDEALAIFRDGVLADPAHATAYRGLGMALWEKGERDAAVTAIRRSTELKPKDRENYVCLVRYLQNKNDLDGVIALYRRLIEVDPENAVEHYDKLGVNLEINKRDLDGALDAYRRSLELAPAGPAGRARALGAHERIGRVLLKKGDLDGARAAFREVIEIAQVMRGQGYPQTHTERQCYREIGETLRRQGDFDGAVAAYRRAVDLEPTYFPDYSVFGMALLRDSGASAKDAVLALRRAAEFYPRNGKIQFDLGEALVRKRDLQGAIAAYSKAIELDPKNYHYRVRRADNFKQMGRWNQALLDWSVIVELRPDDAAAWSSRGVVYFHLGQREKALADFCRAIELHPGLLDALFFRGRIFGQIAHWAGVVADYSALINAQPPTRDARVWFDRGRAYHELRQWDKAAADFAKTLELSPHDAACSNALARLLATCPESNRRDPKRAVELATKAVGRQPQAGDFWATLGMARYRAGDESAAVAAFDKALELSQGRDSVDCWLFLAMAHQKLGHHEEARKWHDRARSWLEKSAPVLEDDPIRSETIQIYLAETEAILGIIKR